MDDLVVIILTLIVVGIGALGQLKKKKQAAANSVQPSQSENFWDLVEEGTGIQGKEEVRNFIEVEKQQPIMKADISSYKFSVKSKDQSKKSDDFTKKSLAINAKKKTIEGFSLRKAVIYSEILNRKYT